MTNLSYMQNNYSTNAHIFRVFILIGIAIAFYVYLFNFKNLSEGELISWIPAWFFPLVIGYYGFVANRVLEKREKTGVEKASDFVFEIAKSSIGIWALPILILLHIPFLFIAIRNAWLTAFLGALFWVLVIYMFLEHVFPYL